MSVLRLLICVFCLGLALPLAAQDVETPLNDTLSGSTRLDDEGVEVDRGRQTLEDIMRRQRGQEADLDYSVTAFGETEATGGAGPLGPLGGASDPDLWEALRFNEAEIVASNNGPGATVLIQDGGMRWLEIRRGPLLTYGAIALGAMIVLLGVFYLIRGRIPVEGPKSGRTLTRFIGVERFAHWLLAGSFVLLALTGLLSLFGRKVLIPVFGHEAFSALAGPSKWIHDNVSWAFIIALVMVFAMWAWSNLPDRTDLLWIRQGGGILTKGHPPAKKFNFGQKIVFWSVIVFGTSIAVSGLSLLFPFEFPLFAATFEKVNAIGLPGLFGQAPLPTDLAPHEEMQLSQLWHSIVGFILMAIILGHIYIGSLGMEGAYSAMGSGQVGEEWAEQHHSIWAEKKKSGERDRQPDATATPAE